MPSDLEGPEMPYHEPGFESGHLTSADKSLACLSCSRFFYFQAWGGNGVIICIDFPSGSWDLVSVDYKKYQLLRDSDKNAE